MANATHLQDGAGFRIVLVNQGITLYEKSVQPRGEEGGDPIDITTNDNTSRKSFAPPKWTEPTPSQAVVTYSGTSLDALRAAVDVSDDIRIEYPDDSTDDAEPGWLRSAIPENAEPGAQPTATVAIAYYGEAAVTP